MRNFAIFAVLSGACLLAGCSNEPNFDERYEKANAEIQKRVKALDAEEARVRAELGLTEADSGAGAGQGAAQVDFRLPVPSSTARGQLSSGE